MNILRSQVSHVIRMGGFQIRRIRPGRVLGAQEDPAFGPLSVVDRATLAQGMVVRMHEHKNDEIFTYMWRGTVLHEDSAKHKVPLSSSRLMMMNAGKSFWHEESAIEGPVEALQIFIRPRDRDLPGVVQFYERPVAVSDGQWHLIGGPERSVAPLKIRQEVTIYDAQVAAGQELRLPAHGDLSPWLYVMAGAVHLGDERLADGDAIADLDAALPAIQAEKDSALVLFLVDRTAQATLGGTISGG
jgi:quercetin 2,3-dioxygenase